MKYILMLFILGASQGALAASPRQIGTWGVGAEVGSISSVSFQASYQDLAAIVIGAGVDDQDGDDSVFHIDHLWYPGKVMRINPYLGLGAGLGLDDKDDDGNTRGIVRIPAGLAFYTREVPLNLFGQLVPNFDTNGDSDFEAQVGLRFIF